MGEEQKVNKWAIIRKRYIAQGGAGVRALAREFGLAHVTIIKRARAENWLLATTGPAYGEPEKVTKGATKTSFLVAGRVFSPQIARHDTAMFGRALAAYDGLIGSQVARFPLLGRDEVLSLGRVALMRACDQYKFGGKVGFDKLVCLMLNRELVAAVRRASALAERELSLDEMDLLARVRPNLRPYVRHKLDGETDAVIARRFGWTRQYVGNVRKLTQEALGDV